LFFKSERSQKLNVTDKKIERLNKIILEAVEQSERNIIPTLII
jgi:RsmE family RNA methyltransferase